MNDNKKSVAIAKPAATVIPVCEIDGTLEVLLLKRNPDLTFGGGDWVFPGGRIDDHEINSPLDELETAKMAAVREAKEEAQLLLSVSQLHYFSRWIAPEFFHKRFDTWFFIAELFKQEVVVDQSEIVDYQWLPPTDAVKAINAGNISVMPPTYITLCELLEVHSFIELAKKMSEHKPMVFLPKPYQDNEHFCMLYPGDALYNSLESVDVPISPQHRLYIQADKSFNYINTLHKSF